jgi:hypothetical protein
MAGKLDQISEAIGGLKATTEGLTAQFDRHCNDDDRRHRENVETLDGIKTQITELKETIAPLARTVTAMEPIVAGYAISQWKKAGAFGLAIVLLSVFGWAAQLLFGKALAWALAHISFMR